MAAYTSRSTVTLESGGSPPEGIITTVVGNGTEGYSGDGGPATAAQIVTPFGVATDLAGNLYVLVQDSMAIRRVSASGIITTVAGNGTRGYSGDGGAATAAQLAYPSGLAADSDGKLYIADSANFRVRQVSPDGIIVTVAGNGIQRYAGDGGPATSAQISPGGVAVDINRKPIHLGLQFSSPASILGWDHYHGGRRRDVRLLR